MAMSARRHGTVDSWSVVREASGTPEPYFGAHGNDGMAPGLSAAGAR